MGDQWSIHPWVAEAANGSRFGVVSVFLTKWDEILGFAQRGERLGFDSYWTNDHPSRFMDCWTFLTGLAAGTERIRLISMVSCIYYRHPMMLARQAADVDRISGGRLVLGVGIGDDTSEFQQMCLQIPPPRERQRALEETLHIVRGLWGEEPFTFSGEIFNLSSATVFPKPVQRPYVPILIGGGGERVTLRQVAQYADMSNFVPHEWAGSAWNATDVERKYGVLRSHCESIGRPYNSILRSHYTPLLTLAENQKALRHKAQKSLVPGAQLRTLPLFATPDQAIAHYQGLADAGVQYFLATINGHDEETVRLLAEAVMPEIISGP